MLLDLFKILIFILQVSMSITLFVSLPVLLVLRVLTVIENKKDLKSNLLTILLPFSVGYFMYYNEESRYFKWYKRLLITFMVIAILGMIYTFYLKFL